MRNKGLTVLVCLCILAILFCACSRPSKVKTVQQDSVAMGSAVSIKVYGTDETQLSNSAKTALQAVSKLDTTCLSKALPTSELYQINHANHTEPQAVSDRLYHALSQTMEVYAHTQGAAALASGALTELWGMDTDEFRVPSEQEIAAVRPLITDAQVTLDAAAQTVSFPQGCILNLGSVGKGMACDVAIEQLQNAAQNEGIQGAVISVGGSIGTFGKPAERDAFTIGIRNPFGGANDFFAKLSVQDTFLSTSGTYEKQFTENGKTYHHLLDLTTGYPKVSSLVSVTVMAKSGLLSDALSTLCFLLGQEAAEPVLQQYGAEAVFVYADKRVSYTAGMQKSFTLLNQAFKVVEPS